MDVKTARENYRELCVRLTTAALTGSIERLARGIRVEDTRLAQDETRPGGVLARIYEPSSGDVGAVAMYVHGGGWRVGDLDSEDLSCRRLALGVPLQVISVTYRLTPEHAYPVPLDDVWAAYFALATSLPPSTPLLLIGSSAGAHLLAICAQRARGMRHIRQPSGLLLRCPVTTHPLSIPVRFQAMYDAWQPASGRPLEKLLLPPTKMDVCHVELAVPVELRASGEAYPLNGELRGLLGGADGGAGRVWVQACDDDVLMPDAVAYVDALREAGIEAALQEVSGGHTFWLKEPGTQAAEAAEDAAVEGAKWVLEGCTGQ